MCRFGRRDQELGRHAPDPRAGRAREARIDQQRLRAGASRGSFGGQSRRPGADDGDVATQSTHRKVLNLPDDPT
jgi:hypothetical protein